MNNKYMEKFMEIAGRIATNRFLVSLRDAFLYASGLTIIAGFVIMLNSVFFDINSWSLIWGNETGGLGLGQMLFGSYDAFAASSLCGVLNDISQMLTMVLQGTINIYAILLVVLLAKTLQENFFPDDDFDPLIMMYAVSGYFISIPWTLFKTVDAKTVEIAGVADSSFFGTRGVFSALIIATLSVFIYKFVVKRGWVIKLPAGVPSAVERSFTALIPGLMVIMFFIVLKALLVMLTPFFAQYFTFSGVITLPLFIIFTLQLPLLAISQSPIFSLIIVSGQNLLQFFGIHGSSVFGPIIASTWTILGLENVAGTGQYIMTDLLFNSFVVVICFALAPLLAISLFSKQVHLKKLMKLSFMPAIFNINEPIIYRTPVVLNPAFFIPYMLCPPLCFFLTAWFQGIGIIPITINAVPWTTPIFINGILATNSLMGGLWQLGLLAMCVIIWMPFVKLNDKNIRIEEHLQ